jgi:alkanesulfonate monooxygenase SsuD/methylene tetrahydromethanopterin reductase-like flavin-dependent oxidoreductase (luciferase family)
MPDYGHDLRFGSFITPTAEHVLDRAVAAAVAAERAGFDLVTFQDHPYQRRFVDTWTLLSFVAARTERVRLAGNVLNLPLRPPAVLAKSVATLDLLCGGRVELGLGAGSFWDAIEAYGGGRLTPGESVTALSEAIDVIRGIWGETDLREARDGTFHSVRGAKPGPAPAHRVEIWLGAYKPRMLRLVGRKADGWLPSIGRMTDDQLTAANKAIDDAAEVAGRDPAGIRRLANVPGRFGPSSGRLLDGPVAQWVEQLTTLAVHHGFSTFILAGDDVDDYQRIAREVIPAVRQNVARARGARDGWADLRL